MMSAVRGVFFLWLVVLALRLPYSFIVALFWFFVGLLALGFLFFVGAFIVGSVYAWRSWKQKQ